MPLAIPAIAGAIAGTAASIAGYSFTTVVIVGAIAGAVVGGISSAIQGGNILEGVLYGAVGGAIGGALAGWGVQAMGWDGASLATQAANEAAAAQGGGIIEATGSGAGGAAAAGSTATGETLKTLAVSGGMQALSSGLKSDPEIPYQNTQAGVEAELAARQKVAETQAAAAGSGSGSAVEAAMINARQRQSEAELNAALTREKMGIDSTEFEKTLAQRKSELERPIEEANAARARQKETASGLTLLRKQQEAAASQSEQEKLFQEDLTA